MSNLPSRCLKNTFSALLEADMPKGSKQVNFEAHGALAQIYWIDLVAKSGNI